MYPGRQLVSVTLGTRILVIFPLALLKMLCFLSDNYSNIQHLSVKHQQQRSDLKDNGGAICKTK